MAMLYGLNERRQEILTAYRVDGLTQTEIAARYNCDQSYVARELQRVSQILRSQNIFVPRAPREPQRRVVSLHAELLASL